MARPRTVSDEDLIAAAIRVMGRLGPAKLTLAAIAKEAGVTAATLVQRFGSKRALLLKLAADAAAGAEGRFQAARAAHPFSPLGALFAAATAMAEGNETPEELANSLGFLQVDTTDPEFQPHSQEMSRRHLAGYKRLLEDAVARGQLKPHDTARMARAINSLVTGSLVSWAIVREGSGGKWVREDIETLLAPYRR